MRFLLLLLGEPGQDGPVPGSAEFGQMLADYQAATDAMAKAGVLVDSGPLQPPGAASTVRVRGGKPTVTDEPAIETKEVIGGFYVLDCADLDAAQEWAATIPAARFGAVEIRPVMVMPSHA